MHSSSYLHDKKIIVTTTWLN